MFDGSNSITRMVSWRWEATPATHGDVLRLCCALSQAAGAKKPNESQKATAFGAMNEAWDRGEDFP